MRNSSFVTFASLVSKEFLKLFVQSFSSNASFIFDVITFYYTILDAYIGLSFVQIYDLSFLVLWNTTVKPCPIETLWIAYVVM